jgi:hypothetical protein
MDSNPLILQVLSVSSRLLKFSLKVLKVTQNIIFFLACL